MRLLRPGHGTSATAFEPRHLLNHEEDQMTVAFIYHAEHATKLLEHPRVFAVISPLDFGCGSSLRTHWKWGRFFPVIEKLVQRDFHRQSQFFQCCDSGGRVSVFNARNVASK